MIESVVAFLSDQEMLLVLDNCEHLLARSASLVADAPPTDARGWSSWRRAGNGWPSRVSGRGPSLRFHCLTTSQSRPSNPAVSLFVDRARAVRPDLRLDRENLARIVDICRHLDGLPLAIELAAAGIRSLNPADLDDRMRARLDLLSPR